MKKYLLISVVSLLVGLGLGLAIPHGANQPGYIQSGEQVLGGAVVNVKDFVYGLTAGQTGQLSVDSSGNLSTSGTANATTVKASAFQTATVGASSSSPAALGSAAAGHFVVAASATTANASTTAITANSSVYLTQELVTPIAGTTCNTALASGTAVSLIAAGNGFQIKVQPAPTTNPYCFSYRITN